MDEEFTFKLKILQLRKKFRYNKIKHCIFGEKFSYEKQTKCLAIRVTKHCLLLF